MTWRIAPHAMELSMGQRQEVTKKLATKYKRRLRFEKSGILEGWSS
jgi:hypothetical protein